jgi:hypothetical protein
VSQEARDEAIKRAQAGETVTKALAKAIVAEHKRRHPGRGSRNRMPPIVVQLLEAVDGVGKELRKWCKRKSNLAFHTSDNELAHDALVEHADLTIAKVYSDDDKLALLLERVEAARASRRQSEAA